MAWRHFAIILALLPTAFAAPAWACSMVGDYVRPSNFELVQIADAIVIAAAEREIGGENIIGSVVLRTERAIKGAPPERIVVDMAGFGTPGPSDLADLSASHPEGHMGPCNRTSFARAGRYLLFLSRGEDGAWHQLGYPFSRVNEDYSGEDNAWMRAVRRYLRLQRSLAPTEQLAALRRMAETGLDGEALSMGERADIMDHLRSISPWKPTPYLLDIHDRLERGESLPFGIRPDSANREAGNLDRAGAFLLGDDPPLRPEDAGQARLAVLNALAAGDHPAALPLFERLFAASRLGARERGLALLYFAHNGQYPRAYRWIESRLMAELPRLPSAEARTLLGHVADVQRGDSYEEGRERWRTDPHAAATWPELALSLYWYQTRTFGADNILPFEDALGAIPLTDYRARPELTLALGRHFDEGARNWALAELARPPRPDPEADRAPGADRPLDPGEDPALLPLHILVSAWTAEAGPLLIRIFCQGGERRRSVIHALGQWGDGLYQNQLAEMASAAGLTDDEKYLLLQAAIEMTARDIRGNGRTTFLREAEPDGWLLSRLIRGQVDARRTPVCGAPG